MILRLTGLDNKSCSTESLEDEKYSVDCHRSWRPQHEVDHERLVSPPVWQPSQLLAEHGPGLDPELALDPRAV